VEGTLFVVRRRAVPSFQFVVLNRLSTENCRENLLGEFEFELSPPYLLYRSESEVNGIWFYRQEECDAMSALFDQITTAFAREPAGVSSVDDTAATLHRLGIGGAPAAAAAPAPAPAAPAKVSDEN
jgi:mRNA-decapping enzyme 1B